MEGGGAHPQGRAAWRAAPRAAPARPAAARHACVWCACGPQRLPRAPPGRKRGGVMS
jgi:hypothetical protein